MRVEYGDSIQDSQVVTTYKLYGYNCRRTWKGKLPLLTPFTWEYVAQISAYETLQKRALQGAFAKIGKKQFGGGENLGEFKETLETLKSPLKSARDFLLGKKGKNMSLLKSLFYNTRVGSKHLKSGGRQSILKTAADTWLELRYGIMPIYYSIQDIRALLEAKAEELDPTRIKTVRKKEKDVSTRNFEFGPSPLFEFEATRTMRTETKARATGIVYFRQSAELPRSAQLGLGLRNLSETMWELTSMSFVVDWFLSVGPWLESWRFNPEYEILGSTVSTKIEVSGETDMMIGKGLQGWQVESSSIMQAPFKAEIFSRALTGIQPPLLPQFAGLSKMNLHRSIDALALLYRPVMRALGSIRR